MFTLDERLKGLPATKEQIVSLYQSINQPHLAVPGKAAGPAQAFIVGLRGGSGFAVFIYLYLAESGDCAVYAPSRRNLSSEEYQEEENEALGFVESMGFMMDNMNFRAQTADDQDSMLRSLPVFQKEPRPSANTGPRPVAGPNSKANVASTLGKLLASFCLALVALSGCRHVPSEADQRIAENHYDLGVLAQQNGDVQQALREYEAALASDPNMPEAQNAYALLLQISFGRPEQAQEHYLRAIELRPDYSEAKNNLATLYLEQQKYDEAIKLCQDVLNDMHYTTPYLAQNNLGWALYKKGEVGRALNEIRSAVTLNQKFCQGYRNLSIIYSEQGTPEEICKFAGKYRENCQDFADPYFREGVCLAKEGNTQLARQSFETCQSKTGADSLKEDCKKYKEQIRP